MEIEKKINEAKLKVELIAHTPTPEKVVAAAAKLCYAKSDIKSLMENLTPEKIEDFVKMLADIGHESPFEHVSFTFGIEGVSRSLTHQLVRHRIGCSYSQQSQRYVKLDQFEYVIPPAIAKNERAKEWFIKAMDDDQLVYDRIVWELTNDYCKEFLGEAYTNLVNTDDFISIVKSAHKKDFTKIEKKAIEDARYVFPNACETKIIVTMNARALFNFFSERCCNRAQWEIRTMSEEMLNLVKAVAPNIFRYCGPACLIDKCPERDMSCGKMAEMRERYLNK